MREGCIKMGAKTLETPCICHCKIYSKSSFSLSIYFGVHHSVKISTRLYQIPSFSQTSLSVIIM